MSRALRLAMFGSKLNQHDCLEGGAVTWTPDKIAIVKRHWGDKTAREIGELVGKSRNAVLGKVQRLGLSGPPNLAGVALSGDKRTRRSRHPCRRRPLTFTSGCQWLDGDPRERNFCGEPAAEGSAYCDAHHRICRIPRAA